MNDPGERFTNLGKVVIDPAMYAGGQKRKPFKKASHMLIVAAVRVEQEPAGNPGILARELPAHLAQIGQFPLIVIQQFFAHALLYLVLTADQFQHCVEFDFFVHVFVDDLSFNVKLETPAE